MPSGKRGSQAALPGAKTMGLPPSDVSSAPHWQDASPTVVAALVGAFTFEGHGVLFGTTKDVSALTLCLYAGGQKASYVYGSVEAAENACREYTEWAMSYRSHVLT